MTHSRPAFLVELRRLNRAMVSNDAEQIARSARRLDPVTPRPGRSRERTGVTARAC